MSLDRNADCSPLLLRLTRGPCADYGKQAMPEEQPISVTEHYERALVLIAYAIELFEAAA